jgi:redox-sensitive bicupin YhaK (pirin superfamily)
MSHAQFPGKKFPHYFKGHMKNEIEMIIDARGKDIGIPVRRILPWAKRRMVGPFIFLDHMGPAILHAPNDHMDVRPHPHIGLSTLTWLFEGKILHRDSLGYVQMIEPGEVNWMTAGKGIAHSEREPNDERTHDRTIHGLQFWVALPKEHEDVEPSFKHYSREEIPTIEKPEHRATVVAGNWQGRNSKLHAYSPMTFVVVTAKTKGKFTHTHPGHDHAVYIVKGKVSINGTTYNETQMIVFKRDSAIEVDHSEDAVFALIGGEAFPEPRYIWWNLVSSDQEKINKAKAAWADGSFPNVPGDHERIPLPEDF